ncbi:MAG TPA: PAS domain S-box protein [Puia sp.]|nr:PAS domain S-box protein [Puia sp.]
MAGNSIKTSIHSFIIPYFIQTDPKGIVHAVCDKMDALLSLCGRSDYIGQPLSAIFNWLNHDDLLFISHINENGLPDSFELDVSVHLKHMAPIRWTCSLIYGETLEINGWQLTGVPMPSLTKPKLHHGLPGINAYQLEKDKELSDSIINSLPGIFYLVDKAGKYLRWNKLFETVSGYSSQEIEKMHPLDFVAEQEKSYIRSRTEKVFTEGVSDAEANLLIKNGSRVPHYFTGRKIMYEGRTCLIGMGIDISERKKAEEKIKLSNERYKLATKATNDAIWDWNIKTSAPFWGEGLYTQFGFKPGPRIAAKGFWESRIHPADKKRVMKSMEQFVKNNERDLWSEEYRFKKANGRYAIVADRGFLVFDRKGKAVRVVGSMQDITEKKMLEKKLLKQELIKQRHITQAVINAQEKERADIGKELHDNVNQILSTCKLYLDLARTNSKKRLSLIDLSVEMLSNSINEIRGISKALVPRSISDLGLVASINDLLEHIRANNTIHVEFYSLGNFDQGINDQQKLVIFRIVQEQVNNVLKHARARNLIIELLVDKSEKIIELNIADDGIGFDPKKIKGFGLSNIITRADLFNGKVNMVTAPEKGCKLSVRLPINYL